jgi:hypothetical protein
LLICTSDLRILASHIEDAVLKYSRSSLRLVVGLAFRIYSEIQFSTGSYTLVAFSGIDLPDKISSPVR